MKSFFLFLFALLCAVLDAQAQLSWSSYNTSGTRVSASAATYDSTTNTYTFTIPASTTHTFVTTNIAPVTLAASQTKTVTFTMTANGGFGPAGTPVINQRFIAYGLFNYGATAPGASGSFTDDVGLWTDSYQQATGIAAEVFGGTSAGANLLAYQSARQLGAAVGPSTGAVGQFTNGSATNVTFRVVENASGTASIGTGTGTTVSGAWYQDAATSGTTFNRTISSGGATTPSGTTTFNEFAFMFFNSTGSSVTLTLKNITGATSASYAISSATGANAGFYSCVATNAAGTATSNSVYVGVLSSTMSLSSVTPTSGASGKNRDVLLKITFSQPVSAGNAGRIRVYDASSPATPVDTIDLSTAVTVTQFGTVYRYMAKTISNVNFNYLPVSVSGNTATIALHSSTALSYGKTYYVNIEPGVMLDASGATYAGISDSSTWSFATKASGPAASAASIAVAADGSGDFDTVQGAVDFVPFSPANTIARTITIANGTYNEIVRLRSGQNLVKMQGQSQAGAIIQYLTNNNSLISGANSIGQRSVFGADPNDFTIQNLTIRNTTPNGGSQAEAFWVGNNAQRMTISALNILSYQDTVMSNGGQAFFTGCYIEGNVDFVWGSGQIFFSNCELKMIGLASGGLYVQARNTPSTFPGYFFYNCQLTKDASVTANSTYLARIDQVAFPSSQVVWMNCKMDTHIISPGWQLNNGSTAPSVKYWEYLSTNLAGAALTITGRPTYNSMATGVGASTVLANQQLDAATAAYFSNAVNAIGWSPVPGIGTQPGSQSANAGQTVTLSVAATAPIAITYQWYKNGGAISGAPAVSYTISGSLPADTGSYTVVVTNSAGSVTSSAAAVSVPYPIAVGGKKARYFRVRVTSAP